MKRFAVCLIVGAGALLDAASATLAAAHEGDRDASNVVATAESNPAGQSHRPEPPIGTAPSVSPEVARLRIKNFLRASLRHGAGGSRGASTVDAPELAEAMAVVDAMTPQQIVDIDAHLSPAVAGSRSLSAWAAKVESGQAQAVVAEDDPALELLRADIDAYLSRFTPYVPRVEARYPAYGELLTRLRSRIQSATPAELARMQEAFNQVPSARAVLSVDPAHYVGGVPGTAQAAANEASTSAAPRDGAGTTPQGIARLDAGSIHTLSACNDMTFGPVAVTVLSTLAKTALDVAALLSDDYMTGTFNIPEIATIIARIIALPLELISLAATADLTYFINCNEGAHQVLFDEHVAESTERMAAILSLIDDGTKLTDIRRTIANRADRMDVFAVEFRRLTLRLAIEQDLVRHGDPRIALFQVPNAMCVTVGEHQSCGQLDTVRDVVADTILDNRSAGFDTSLASVALQDGDSQRALGLYKAAYTRYRYAYQLAVRSN